MHTLQTAKYLYNFPDFNMYCNSIYLLPEKLIQVLNFKYWNYEHNFKFNGVE